MLRTIIASLATLITIVGEAAEPIRFATFNVSLYDQAPGKLTERLTKPDDRQAAAIAEIVQRVRPDVLLLNEFDYDDSATALENFCRNYLATGQNASNSASGPADPIEYPYYYIAPSNTGIPAGYDLDRDGSIHLQPGDSRYGGDCWGYGEYPGKYAMALLSRCPIEKTKARTFQNFLWRDMPGALLPEDPSTHSSASWYSDATLAKFPLSSKSHWDVPIRFAGRTIHVLASHPTPPTYDGPEDRNGRRNHDEIRFWADYVDPEGSKYIYDDEGNRGGLADEAPFVIMGDLNGDPADGQGKQGISLLLSSPRIDSGIVPESDGGEQQAALQGGANTQHQGNPRFDTLDAADSDGPGNLRVDYVLPATNIKSLASGVFWPKNTDRLFSLVGTHPFPSSDHRLVWIDIELPPTSD
ncbi:MAG: endonuclease/exonuclease/phosphatase family protein [Planctomycetota bacterium]